MISAVNALVRLGLDRRYLTFVHERELRDARETYATQVANGREYRRQRSDRLVRLDLNVGHDAVTETIEMKHVTCGRLD